MLRWGFEAVCKLAGIPFGESTLGWSTDTIETNVCYTIESKWSLRIDIQDLLGNSKPGFTTVYMRATHAALEAAVEKLIEPIAQLVEFRAKGRIE